jgi:hypothetical protein
VKHEMESCFGKTPRDWQYDVCCHLIEMGIPKARVQPEAVFLVQTTGGGKSLVRDTVAAATKGVTLSISPLLSLGADQESALNLEVYDDCGPIGAYHLDEFSTVPTKQTSIVKEALALTSDTTKCIILFSSPQAIVENKVWCDMVAKLIDNGILRLVCVDEVHLFCSFGLSIRGEIAALKPCLFSKLVVPSDDGSTTTVCPVLVMTATATKNTVEQFTKLTGLAISTDSNVFWPIGPDMSRRELNICVEYTTNPMEKFKKQCSDLLEENDTTKVILYTNSRFASEKYQKSIVDWMDVTGYHGDVILINGSLTKEEKFHRSRLFSKKDEGRTMVLPVAAEPCEGSDAPAVTSESIPVHNPYTNESSTSLPEGIAPDDPAFDSYSARILVATVDSISAGLNVDTVRNVTQTELPSSVPNLLQPAGRAGRYPGALPLHNRYTNYISLKGYVYLFRRLHLPVEDAKEDGATVADTAKIVGADEYRKQQLEELKQMNRLLAIPQECLHVRWEQLMGNPFIPPSPDTHYKPPCGTDCSFCRQEYKAMFRPISKSGTQKILSALFIGDVDSDGRAIPPISDRTMDGLVAAIQEYPRSRILLFGGRTTSEKKPEPVQVSKVLLLLLASDILTLAIKYDAGDRAKKNPIVVFALDMSNGIHLYVDEYWSCLPLQTE